jgi:hypothetical protein
MSLCWALDQEIVNLPWKLEQNSLSRLHRGSDHQRKVSPVSARIQDCRHSSGVPGLAALLGVRSADAGLETPTGERPFQKQTGDAG